VAEVEMKYKKSLNDLEKVAVKWWPKSLEEAVAKISVIPKLLETQSEFLSILNLSGKFPEQIFDVLNASGMPPNLFLKHLVVLADFGGEPIKRLGKEFSTVFPPDPKRVRTTLNSDLMKNCTSISLKPCQIKA
jgi:hypothetical protein